MTKKRSTLNNPRYRYKDGRAAHKMSINFVIDDNALYAQLFSMISFNPGMKEFVFYDNSFISTDQLTPKMVEEGLRYSLRNEGYNFVEEWQENIEDERENQTDKYKKIKQIMIKFFPKFVKGDNALKFLTEED